MRKVHVLAEPTLSLASQVQSWDLLERFTQQAVFQVLRVDPEDHAFVVTEHPAAPPESRESMAEVGRLCR
jgi:actin-related protein